MTLEQANAKLTMVYRAYFKARPEFEQWREEFQIGLIEAVAEDTVRTLKQIKVRMKREKYQRVMENNSKCIRQKNARDSILWATATNDNGEFSNVKMKKKWYRIWQSQIFPDSKKVSKPHL